jgi:hypothetical protein
MIVPYKILKKERENGKVEKTRTRYAYQENLELKLFPRPSRFKKKCEALLGIDHTDVT